MHPEGNSVQAIGGLPASTIFDRIKRVRPYRDRLNKGWLVPIPQGLPDAGRRIFRRRKADAQAVADRINDCFAGRSAARASVPLEDIDEFFLCHPLYAEIRELDGSSLDQILREARDRRMQARASRSLEQLRLVHVANMREDSRSARQIARITHLKLPDPDLPIPLVGDAAAIDAYINGLITFAKGQWDRDTGEGWDRTTYTDWFRDVSAVLNEEESSHSAARRIASSKQFRRQLRDDLCPAIHKPDELEIFLTYVHAQYPAAALFHLFKCQVGFRTLELLRVRWQNIKLAEPGTIFLDDSIATKTDGREISEIDVPEFFAYVRAHLEIIGAPHDLIFEAGHGLVDALSRMFRELFYRAFPANIARHTAASRLYRILRSLDGCARVIGHSIRSAGKPLRRHYLRNVSSPTAQALGAVVPLEYSGEVEARIKWRLYTSWLDVSASTFQWGHNHIVQNSHHLNTNKAAFIDRLRLTRPIFADRSAKVITISVLWPDASRTEHRVTFPTVKQAKRQLHMIRVAVWTGIGVLDLTTGEVRHYERNYGIYCGYALFVLKNPERLEEELVKTRTGRIPLGRRIGFPCDRIRRLTEGRDGCLVPEPVKLRLEAFCQDLTFDPAGRSKRRWNQPPKHCRKRSRTP